MITVRKFQLIIENENKELKNNQYQFIRDSQYAQYQGLNKFMGYLVSNYYACGMNIKSEEFQACRKLSTKAPLFDNINFGKGVDTKAMLKRKVLQDFDIAFKNGFAKGERSATNYKRTFPLMTYGRHLRFFEKDDEYFIKWVNKLVFKVVLSKKEHKNYVELQHFLRKVLTGEYKVGQSSLEFNKKNKLILNLTCDIPTKTKGEFVEGRTLGVDLGLAVPAYVSVSDNIQVRKGFGSYEEFARTRQQFKARKARLYKQRELAKGGKGRKKKMKSLDELASKESNFAKTYNHQLSHKIVEFALKNQCEYINLEKINSETLDDRLLAQWSYYQLQEQIIYKAERVGIKVRKVNPKYTSQKCSCCGHISKDNRPKGDKGQAYFSCTNPECKMHGEVINADWNASINIARSEEFVK